jgi:hypothetical protein
MAFLQNLSRFAMGLILVFAVASPAPAFSQVIVYPTNAREEAELYEGNCLAGYVSYSAARFAAAREGARQTMQRYLSLAGSVPAADVRNVFSSRGNEQDRFLDKATGRIIFVDDPVARAFMAQSGSQLGPPDSFFWAGDGKSVAGAWTIRFNTQSSPSAGYYRGVFRLERGQWKLVTLLSLADAPEQELTQYCRTPGDVRLRRWDATYDPTEDAAPVGAPPEGKAQVVFFRPSYFMGSALTFTVHEGEAEIGGLSAGRYFVHVAAPGAHEFATGRGRTIRIEMEPNRTYYVRVTFIPGAIVGHGDFLRSDRAAFDVSRTTLRVPETVAPNR